MSRNFAPCLDHIAKELAPLEPVSRKKLPPGMEEGKALQVFLAVNATLCPMIAHLAEFGFDIDQTRRFLSAFAGHTIEVPSRRTLHRSWTDFQIWLALQKALHHSDLDKAAKRVANRFKSSKRRVLQIYERYQDVKGVLESR